MQCCKKGENCNKYKHVVEFSVLKYIVLGETILKTCNTFQNIAYKNNCSVFSTTIRVNNKVRQSIGIDRA